VYNQNTDHVEVFEAPFVILATGGASKVYLYTSNPDGSTGDGIAMAWRAGCRVANMEFNQFHPTCLYHPHAKSFLISEAVRGEGGLLLLPDGERFMPKFDARAELAPRDVVARAIDHEMKRLGADCVYLDISHQPDAQIKTFPNIYAACAAGITDITRTDSGCPRRTTRVGVVVDSSGATDIPDSMPSAKRVLRVYMAPIVSPAIRCSNVSFMQAASDHIRAIGGTAIPRFRRGTKAA
jgi:L-aspartate oxidase